MDDDEESSLPDQRPAFKSVTLLQRTGSPLNVSKSPVNPPAASASGGADAKGKGKKRKSEAGEKVAAGEGGTPAKKKKKPVQVKKPAGEKGREGDSSKSPTKGQLETGHDRGGHEGEGEAKEGDGEEGEDEEDLDEEDDLAMDDKYKEMQEQRNKLFQDQLKSDADWNRYVAMRRANLNNRETKALIAAAADLPESQLKDPVVFTLKGMAKVLVGQLVDNARLVRQEWGEEEAEEKGEPLQPRHIHESYRRLMRNGAIPPTTTEVKSPFNSRR